MSAEASKTQLMVGVDSRRPWGLFSERQAAPSFDELNETGLRIKVCEALGHHGIFEDLEIQPVSLPEAVDTVSAA